MYTQSAASRRCIRVRPQRGQRVKNPFAEAPIWVFCSLLLWPFVLNAQTADDPTGRQELEAIDDQVQTLKSEVIQINHELSLLEEKLLFPSTTQIAIFVALQSEFELDAVQLKIDNQVVGNHIYNFRELEALRKGGVQRVYTGNVASGAHQLSVEIKGGGNSNKTEAFTFKKEIGPKFVEIRITGSGRQPQIQIKDW